MRLWVHHLNEKKRGCLWQIYELDLSHVLQVNHMEPLLTLTSPDLLQKLSEMLP